MSWQAVRSTDRLTEWQREDGHATIRLRSRPDGGWVVRFDRLVQAPEGDGYRRETAPNRAGADELVERWRRAFDVDGSGSPGPGDGADS